MKIPRPDHVDAVLEQWTRERPDLDLTPVAVIARLGRASRYVDDAMERAFAPHGLTRAAWDVLAALRRAGPPFRLTPTELYRALMRSSGAMTNRLQRLELAGLVIRVGDPDDRRSVLVELTERGRQLCDEVATAHLANERRLLEALSGREQEQLAGLLKTLLLAYESDRPTPPGTAG